MENNEEVINRNFNVKCMNRVRLGLYFPRAFVLTSEDDVQMQVSDV